MGADSAVRELQQAHTASPLHYEGSADSPEVVGVCKLYKHGPLRFVRPATVTRFLRYSPPRSTSPTSSLSLHQDTLLTFSYTLAISLLSASLPASPNAAMLFLSLFVSAVALLGNVAASPVASAAGSVEPRAAEVAHARSFDHVGESAIDLNRRAASAELQSFVDAIEAGPLERSQYMRRVRTSCEEHWPGHNVFIFFDGGDFRYSLDDPNAMEAKALNEFWLVDTQIFTVAVFRSAGVLEKVSGDGGAENWQMSGWFVSENEGTKAVFSAPP